MELIGDTRFKLNKADRRGGALHWDVLEPNITDSVLFEENKAHHYGDEISCFA